ncbi:hypothetical protein K504DRAFT_423492 [Pleomassaria siparia CBS 279.74]|uniref:Uncharacterized protein n=1 Tax=Pleomassaria siparia CBS 279.74 TaxID=1314801 RepID=A0A6G1KJW0_9PLEO|nr:hypothetical protein K504DRAFT_423492 [Pleomassaria siparia CBS 279.74]
MPLQHGPTHNFASLLKTLLPTANLVHAPPHARHSYLTSQIANLSLHPALEASLHILNADLPSAHFLVRHMSGPPAIEGMILHSILHRTEGDFDNARAWMRDVEDACEGWVPKKKGKARLEEKIVGATRGGGTCGREGEQTLVGYVYYNSGEREDGNEREAGSSRPNSNVDVDAETGLEERIRTELQHVIEWCRDKFGDQTWVDASEAWVRPGEEVRSMGNDMVSGGKGWRMF